MEPYLAAELLHYCNVSVKRVLRISPHVIDYYDFTFVLDGEMTYLADGKTVVLQKNDALLLPPNTRRERLAGQSPVRYVSFNFKSATDVSFPFPIYLEKSITHEMKTAVLNFPPSHLVPNTHSYEKCLSLLNYLLFSMLDLCRSKSRNEHVNRMLAYIDTHIAEKLTLKELSAEIGLSREYASYLFRREMGQTLTDYVNGQKLELAREMLLGGQMSLVDIASSLGFENYNYFSRAFKARFGVAPIRMKN